MDQGNDILDSEEFYNLMQTYRWADMIPELGHSPEDTVRAFEAVKDWIRKKCGEPK